MAIANALQLEAARATPALRTIRGGVIAISVFDLMTLNIASRVSLGCGIIFTKFELRQLSVPEL